MLSDERMSGLGGGAMRVSAKIKEFGSPATRNGIIAACVARWAERTHFSGGLAGVHILYQLT